MSTEWKLVESIYKGLTQKAVAQVKALSDLHRLGIHSKLTSFWEEFKFQMQREESVAFDLCERTVRGICRGLIEELDQAQQAILWEDSDERFNWPEEGEVPFGYPVTSALENALYHRVCLAAEQEELEFDPSEEWDRARLEEDWELSNLMMERWHPGDSETLSAEEDAKEDP